MGSALTSEVEEGLGSQGEVGGAAGRAQLLHGLLCLPVSRSDYHRAVFCYGDTKGNVIIFTSDDVTTGLFNPRVLPRTSKWGRETWGVRGDGPVLGAPPCPIPGEEAHQCAQLRTTIGVGDA